MLKTTNGIRRRKRQYTMRMENIIQHGSTLALLVLLSTAQKAQAVEENEIIPRWGHAAAYIPSPPTLIIQGGKTDPSSSYTYSSSPNTGETLILPLNSGFSTSSPPITSLDIPSAPTSAWHTLTPLSSSEGTWQLLSFGGDGGTLEAVQTGTNSAWIMSTNPTEPTVEFSRPDISQPMRRIYHSASSASSDGKVYITGGIKADGSGSTFSDVYAYDSTSSSFTPLPSLPVGLYHHNSLLLPNGTLLALGGAHTSLSTGGAALQPYSTIYSLDTTASSPVWIETNIGGTIPVGRRGATLVLNEDGSKAFLFGGANAGLGEAYGDGWEFNLADCTWKQVVSGNQGAGARYDHTAVSIGGNQVAIFGGHGTAGPADSTLHLWDSSTNSWVTTYTPIASSSASTSATASGGKSATMSGISTSHGLGTKTMSASGSEPIPSGVTTHSSSASASASASSTSTPTDAGAHSHPLTTPIKIGLILGVLAVVGILLGLCLWRYRRRRNAKRAAATSSPWPGSGPRGRIPSRPYGSREKGGEGLMEQLSPEKPIEGGYEAWGVREKGASIGLGMGAIGATLHSISSKFSGKKEDPYAELDDDTSEEIGGPLRKSSRKIGDGIRLLGPRPQREKSLYYSPEKPVRKASIIRTSRIDMFKEEDSTLFHNIASSSRRKDQEEEDWVMNSDESGRNWKSAKSILDNRQSPSFDDNQEEENPFHDREYSFDDDAPILPPVIRGGPVPTPHESRSDLGTFDEIASLTMSNPHSNSELSRNPYSDISRNRLSTSSSQNLQYHLPNLSPSDPIDLAGLLVPPGGMGSNNRYSQSSIPISARSGQSGQSNALSDAEEGIISEAHYMHSQSPTLVSPSEVSYIPIKRSESFFKRMAAGGITSLLSSTKSTHTQKKEFDIRDPAPQPTLWPVISKDELNFPNDPSPISPSTNSTHPPISWKGDILELPGGNNHGKGPSLSSLSSARSMRDMVLVQRETTTSSIESEAIIERSSPTRNHDREYSDDSLTREEENDFLSPIPIETSTIPHHDGSRQYRNSTDSPTIGGETPGEIVFNGADFASPPILPTTTLVSAQTSSTSTPKPERSYVEEPEENDIVNESPHSRTSLRPTTTPVSKRISSATLNTTVIDESSLPPSGSPVPSPLVQHRRPVRDVVNSINKRGSQTPFSLLSPLSNYSPALDRRISINNTGTSSSVPSTSKTGPNSIIEEDPFMSNDDTPKPKPREKRISSSQRPMTIHGSPTSSSKDSATYPIERITSPTGNRINKRNTSSSDKRPTTMWEVIKRDQLKIANPDSQRRS